MFLVMVSAILLIGARRNLGSSTSASTVALGLSGLVMYALGGLTWNVDNHFCRRLGQTRGKGVGGRGRAMYPTHLLVLRRAYR